MDDSGAPGTADPSDLALADAAIDAAAGAPLGQGLAGRAVAEVNPLIAELIRTLRSERAAPELLPFDPHVPYLLQEVAAQRAYLDGANRATLADEACVADLYESDLNRLRFCLATYLRIRLAKVRAVCEAGLESACGGCRPPGRAVRGAAV